MPTGNAHRERFRLWCKHYELLLSNWRIDSSFDYGKYCWQSMWSLLYNRFEQLWKLRWEPFSISYLNSLIFRWCISSQWKSFGKYWNKCRKFRYGYRWRRWFQYYNEYDWSYWRCSRWSWRWSDWSYLRWIFLGRSSIFGNGHCHIRFTISDSINSVNRKSDLS